MDVSDLKGLFGEVKKRMDAQIEHVRRELGGVRTGRASVGILDTVHVDAYGSSVPLNQVASLSIPEPTLIVAQPFDPSLMGTIEKAIRSSNLGLNPTNDGNVIRLAIPQLNDERRKDLVKQVQRRLEELRVAIRNLRRDALETLRKEEKDKVISEDDLKRGQERLQKITDQFVAQVDEIGKAKEREILETS